MSPTSRPPTAQAPPRISKRRCGSKPIAGTCTTRSSGAADFVLLDVRGPEQFAAGHVPGARNLPHRKIVAGKLGDHPADTLFVVYCAGPHCNGAARAAIRLARLGRPVKLMIGGIAGWRDEGFALSNDAQMETGAMN
jgi:rhodanese-related sulfurtransferase